MRFTYLLLSTVLAAGLLAAQSHPVHVTVTAIPSSLTAPTPNEGTALNTTVYVDLITIANTDTSSHTVTVVDCTSGTAFSLFTAAPIAASTTWVIPLLGTRFASCFKWSASSTTVMGSMVGKR